MISKTRLQHTPKFDNYLKLHQIASGPFDGLLANKEQQVISINAAIRFKEEVANKQISPVRSSVQQNILRFCMGYTEVDQKETGTFNWFSYRL